MQGLARGDPRGADARHGRQPQVLRRQLDRDPAGRAHPEVRERTRNRPEGGHPAQLLRGLPAGLPTVQPAQGRHHPRLVARSGCPRVRAGPPAKAGRAQPERADRAVLRRSPESSEPPESGGPNRLREVRNGSLTFDFRRVHRLLHPGHEQTRPRSAISLRTPPSPGWHCLANAPEQVVPQLFRGGLAQRRHPDAVGIEQPPDGSNHVTLPEVSMPCSTSNTRRRSPYPAHRRRGCSRGLKPPVSSSDLVM